MLLAAGVSYLHWGLGYSLTPVIAVYFAREAEKKGISVDFPFLLASAYAGVRSGNSACPPARHCWWRRRDISWRATSASFLCATPYGPRRRFFMWWVYRDRILLSRWLMPRMRSQRFQSSRNPTSLRRSPKRCPDLSETFRSRLERHPFMMVALCVALGAWLLQHFFIGGRSLDVNSLNTILLVLTLLLHGNFKRSREPSKSGRVEPGR